MHPHQSSITAENNAVLRSHETMRPKGERVCSDPYAVYFLPDRILSATHRNREIDQHISDWESYFPGVCNAIIARTRFIDDCLEAAIRAGIKQLVILGAGFDTRALRFEALKKQASVFELDHPATQKTKRDRIAKYINADLPHVRYISIDFTRDALDQKLITNGYDPRLKTLFIWEGVTYYIPASAVDHTLDFISGNAPTDSRIVFDYFPSSVADGTTRMVEANALRDGLRSIGEEILFGIVPNQITKFMEARGFSVVENCTRRDYKAAYFTGKNKSRKTSEMFLFVHAKINPI